MYLCAAPFNAVGLEVAVNSKDLLPDITTSVTTESGEHAPSRPTVRVKEVPERDRRRLLMHFLALSNEDRLLRFGTALPDELITRYVQHVDFSRDTVLGVYDAKLRLVGVGHLAFAPREARPLVASATSKERIAEFGVSVSESARGMGVGTRLFERAAMHCRNADVDTLYMHCLASNQTMMHIAKKAGMQIHRDHGEADAYLKLAPANPASVLQEAVEEQVASLDYTLKANTRAALKILGNIPGFKS
jgi:GNAT superfamily N-acetyltransferase